MTGRVLAEVARFELTNVGVKDRCLTAWLHLNILKCSAKRLCGNSIRIIKNISYGK